MKTTTFGLILLITMGCHDAYRADGRIIELRDGQKMGVEQADVIAIVGTKRFVGTTRSDENGFFALCSSLPADCVHNGGLLIVSKSGYTTKYVRFKHDIIDETIVLDRISSP